MYNASLSKIRMRILGALLYGNGKKKNGAIMGLEKTARNKKVEVCVSATKKKNDWNCHR